MPSRALVLLVALSGSGCALDLVQPNAVPSTLTVNVRLLDFPDSDSLIAVGVLDVGVAESGRIRTLSSDGLDVGPLRGGSVPDANPRIRRYELRGSLDPITVSTGFLLVNSPAFEGTTPTRVTVPFIWRSGTNVLTSRPDDVVSLVLRKPAMADIGSESWTLIVTGDSGSRLVLQRGGVPPSNLRVDIGVLEPAPGEILRVELRVRHVFKIESEADLQMEFAMESQLGWTISIVSNL